MNKKIIFTSVCLILGCLSLTDAALAKSNNANKQSMKKCPRDVVQNADVKLTRAFPNSHFNDNGTPLTFDDDFYEVCSDVDFIDCDPATIPVPEGTGLTIVGTNRSNTIEGTPGDDTICGLNGKDTIDGKAGNDIIFGNNGSDDLSGGLGDDSVYGGNGRDTVRGFDADHDDFTDLELETDFPGATDDDIVLEGGNGRDIISGGPGADALRGGNGKDDLDGGDGLDDIDGGRANDDCLDDDDDIGVDDCEATEAEEVHGPNHS